MASIISPSFIPNDCFQLQKQCSWQLHLLLYSSLTWPESWQGSSESEHSSQHLAVFSAVSHQHCWTPLTQCLARSPAHCKWRSYLGWRFDSIVVTFPCSHFFLQWVLFSECKGKKRKKFLFFHCWSMKAAKFLSSLRNCPPLSPTKLSDNNSH